MPNTKLADHATTTDRLFKLAIGLKGLDGALQIIGALVLVALPPTLIIGLANTAITRDLVGDPSGTLARHLWVASEHFAQGGTRWFAIGYLFAHGLIKLILVWALLRHILPAFPVAIVVLSGFVIYEVWRAVETHSIALPIFAAIDVAIIVMVVREYRQLRRRSTS